MLAARARSIFFQGVSVVADATQPRRNCWRTRCLALLPPAPAALAVAALALATVSERPAVAQSFDRPSIDVARTIAAQPVAQVAFPIRVRRAPRESFARVRGLPPTASLSEGHSIIAGTWAVPLSALTNLTITLPPMAAGSRDVVVTLVSPDGSVLAETSCTLVIAAMQAPTPDDRRRALHLLQKGNDQLSQGLVASARLLYERASDMGLAEAAMALAATYDAAELGRGNLKGVQPDAKEARRWYERARMLGAPDVEPRLERLP
jgi:hypothetical protein